EWLVFGVTENTVYWKLPAGGPVFEAVLTHRGRPATRLSGYWRLKLITSINHLAPFINWFLCILRLPTSQLRLRPLIRRSPHSWGVRATLDPTYGGDKIFFKNFLRRLSDSYSPQKHAGF